MELVHRETVDRAGRRGGAARRRREPRRAARAARRRHAGGQVPRQEGPGPAPRRLPGGRHRGRRSAPLRDAGLRLIDETPRTGIRVSRVAFLHPASTGGVLTEIVQPAEEPLTWPTTTQARRPRLPRRRRAVPAPRRRQARRAAEGAHGRRDRLPRDRGRGRRRARQPRARSSTCASSPTSSALASEPRRPLVEPLQRGRAQRGGARAPGSTPSTSSAYRAIRSLARDERRVAAVRRFSALGEHGALWLALGAARLRASTGAAARRWRTATRDRRRRLPDLDDDQGRDRPPAARRWRTCPQLMATPTGLSFPSSHSSSSFAAAQAYRRLRARRRRSTRVAVPMALSRLFLGVHYPSDIARRRRARHRAAGGSAER